MKASHRPFFVDQNQTEGWAAPVKRWALIAIFILLALALCACGQTDITALEPEATPTLSTKLIAAQREPSETVQAGTLPQLETDRHIVYLEPIKFNCFAPDQPMRRGDAIESLYTLLKNPIEGRCSFADVDEDDELYEALCCMTAWGVVSDSTGDFNPTGLLSRAQLVSMLAHFYPAAPDDDVQAPYVGSFQRRSAEVERVPQDDAPAFSDIDGHWAATAIENAVARGWIDPGGKFYPDAAVTRAEFCHILNRVLGRHGDTAVVQLSGEYASYTDLPADHEYFSDVLEASCAHKFVFDENGTECWRSETLEPGFQRVGGKLYYVQEDGTLLRNASLQQWDFDENGCYTTGVEETDAMLQSILLSLGTDDMSQSDALRKVYLYCTHGRSYIYHNYYTYGFDGVNDEFAFRALLFFKAGGGYCYDFAAGFGLLARSLGYNCYIVKATVNQYYAPHGFVVIPENGTNYIYDPELESQRDYISDYGLYRIVNHTIFNYWYDPWW